jgi:hypothetical protein
LRAYFPTSLCENDMDNKFYTYVHKKMDTGEVFYVGKGINKRAWDTLHRNKFWQNVVKKHGFTAEIVSYWDSEQDALNQEVELISKHKATGAKLCNLTAGGDGIVGLKRTKEHNKKISISKIGHKVSEKTKQKMSDSAKKRANTPEYKQWLSDLKKGKPLSEIHKKNVSIGMTGKKRGAMSDETKEKIRMAKIGKKLSNETKAKMSLSQTKRRILEKESYASQG